MSHIFLCTIQDAFDVNNRLGYHYEAQLYTCYVSSPSLYSNYHEWPNLCPQGQMTF